METLILVSIFLAIVLSILGFVMLLKYRRFGNDKTELLDQKLNSINNALDGCERMIDELNKLSDYIISNVEHKSIELKGLIDKADEKVSAIKVQLQPRFEVRSEPETLITAESVEANKPIKASSHSKNDVPKVPKKKKVSPEDNIVVIPKEVANAYKANANGIIPPKKRKSIKNIIDSVIIDDNDTGQDKGTKLDFVINSKAKEVIELSKQGLNTTQIAKHLGIGKGEIELILGIKR